MPQINKGDTFADGQQVTATRLNQFLDSATLLVGSITSQAEVTEAIAPDDYVNVADTSTNLLKKASVTALLGGGSPVVTSSITGSNGTDISVTPNDGTIVAGSTYTSADGLTVVVTTATPHGLSVGQVVLISAAGTGYNGTFRITVAAGSSFTYVMTTAATAGSGTLSYVKKGTQKVNGNLAVTGNSYVTGNEAVAGNLNVSGTVTLGSTSVTSLAIGGKTPMTTQDNLTKVYTKSANTSGATGAGVENLIYQTPTLTIPSDETWIYEFFVQSTSGYVNGNTRPDYGTVIFKCYNNAALVQQLVGSTSPYGAHTCTFAFAKALTSADNGAKLIFKQFNQWGLNTEPWYQVTLTKVKTSTLSDASACI